MSESIAICNPRGNFFLFYVWIFSDFEVFHVNFCVFHFVYCDYIVALIDSRLFRYSECYVCDACLIGIKKKKKQVAITCYNSVDRVFTNSITVCCGIFRKKWTISCVEWSKSWLKIELGVFFCLFGLLSFYSTLMLERSCDGWYTRLQWMT